MKLELKTSFLFGLLIGLLLVLLFGKPRKAAKPTEKPAAKAESVRPARQPFHRPSAGAHTFTGKNRTIDVEAEQANFDAETEALDRQAFTPLQSVYTSLRERKAQMEQAQS